MAVSDREDSSCLKNQIKLDKLTINPLRWIYFTQKLMSIFDYVVIKQETVPD